jgi:hypothetical protein
MVFYKWKWNRYENSWFIIYYKKKCEIIIKYRIDIKRNFDCNLFTF